MCTGDHAEAPTYRGWISPGMCDVNGHFNVAFYAQIFDSACWAFLERLAGPMKTNGLGWADVQHTTRFLGELHQGATVEVRSAIKKVGTKSLVTEHRLFVVGATEPSATVEMVTVRFDLTAREAVHLEDDVRARANAFLEASA